MDKIVQYFQENPIFAWILLACCVLLVISIVLMIIQKVKKSKISKSNSSNIPNTDDQNTDQEKISDRIISEEKNNCTKNNSVTTDCSSNIEENKSSEIHEESPILKTTEAKKQCAAENSETNNQKSTSNSKPINETIKKPQTDNHSENEKVLKQKSSGYTGKWLIFHKEETDTYFFELRASNGEKLLTSIDYTSLSGTKGGIKTHKNNILNGNLVICETKNNEFFFKLLNGSKQLLCIGETYATRTSCENAVNSVKRFAETAVIKIESNNNSTDSPQNK